MDALTDSDSARPKSFRGDEVAALQWTSIKGNVRTTRIKARDLVACRAGQCAGGTAVREGRDRTLVAWFPRPA